MGRSVYIKSMSLVDRNKPVFWDVRLRDALLRREELAPPDVEAYISNLPDVGDKAVACTPYEELMSSGQIPIPAFSQAAAMGYISSKWTPFSSEESYLSGFDFESSFS